MGAGQEVSAGSAIGIEAGYGDFGTFGTVATITNIEPLPGASSDTESAPYRIKLKGPKLGLNGAFQFADAWQFHLRGGWFRANTKSSAYFPLNDFHLRRSEQQNGHYLGAGISRNFGPQWSAGIDYDYYSVGGRRERDRNADYAVKALTASAEYRF
jgi:opacity protein-like surface antigen